jgi:hypothetical protein
MADLIEHRRQQRLLECLLEELGAAQPAPQAAIADPPAAGGRQHDEGSRIVI